MHNRRNEGHLPSTANARITIVDIARMADVNPSTVSRALAGSPTVAPETRERIVDLAKRSGYVANHGARMLRSQRADQILVIVPNIAASFYPEVLVGVEEALDGKAFNVIVGSTRCSEEREAALGRQLLTGAADGLILMGGRLSSDLIGLAQYRQRIIAISRPIPGAGIAFIGIDNRVAAADATRHLLSSGRTDIVHLTGSKDSPIFAARAAGYRDAMQDAGLSSAATVIHLPSFNIAAGRSGMLDLVSQSRVPHAILCASDEIAFGAIQVARQGGLDVPGDIAFIGFDDHPISEAFEPALTTIAIPRREMGFMGAQMLLGGMVGDENALRDKILPHRLLIRRSCGHLGRY
jgi:LacI family transcriptional regulator/LacI family repressor for deo operon, udp, cdd, tsx, nupC, and nupG